MELALSIIQILADSPGHKPVGVTEIAGHLDRLGWALYQTAHRLPHATGVHAVAQPLIREAAARLGETVNLAVRYEVRMVIIESCGVASGLKVETPQGVPQPLHNSAAGKALIVDLDESALCQLCGLRLEATTDKTLASPKALAENLVACRRRGYTLDNEETDEGVHCVGVPIRDHRGQVVASLSVTGPSQRLAGKKLEEAATCIRTLALEISRAVGFSGATTG